MANRCWAIVVKLSLVLLSATTCKVTAWGQQPGTPEHVSLANAIQRAEANEPVFASAVAAQRFTRIDSYLAKAALLPSVTYHNQMLYTQPNGQTNQGGQVGVQSSPVFIANNSIHEYTSQASVDERISLSQIAGAQVASANAAVASAELEVARRGLVAAVVNLYYTVSAAESRQKLLEEGLAEARNFTEMTTKREAAREVAHADVVKATLQQQQRQRDLLDATIGAQRARLELAVLLFPDPRMHYAPDAPTGQPALPTRDEVNRMASANNPEIRSALATVNAANAGVRSAKAAYLPDVALNVTYGIDAPQFAKRGPDEVRNLGYSISGTVDVPVWNWFSTQKRIRQSEILRDAAKVNLTAAQRRLVATLEESYAEAAAARDQLVLLEKSVQTAEESMRLTKLRYTAGESTALEVVDAQNSLLTAQTSQVDGLVRYETAWAALQLLTGNL
ncbi:TolC family protein [Edaphobacter sp. 12200R-103]|uniref:TolC family protein n=1 Tax=Edaphobacter sp. 12200R-103 TaxID=2703788 RepID=UPI00138BEE81|nr:TolC family protein [Edaphobacter sp. 12200R-103]QHS50678.1 TolC family protein [Edaphobacter sp. 12200R-103]